MAAVPVASMRAAALAVVVMLATSCGSQVGRADTVVEKGDPQGDLLPGSQAEKVGEAPPLGADVASTKVSWDEQGLVFTIRAYGSLEHVLADSKGVDMPLTWVVSLWSEQDQNEGLPTVVVIATVRADDGEGEPTTTLTLCDKEQLELSSPDEGLEPTFACDETPLTGSHVTMREDTVAIIVPSSESRTLRTGFFWALRAMWNPSDVPSGGYFDQVPECRAPGQLFAPPACREPWPTPA